MPDAWKRVTIYQLLTNTSGIPSYDDAAGFHSQLATTVTRSRLLHFAETLSPEFPAGTGWRYSNTNFVLLGLAIEKITREPYAEYLRRTTFAPLEMRRTGACAEPAPGTRTIASHREVAPPIDPSQMWGSICSTAGDLALWAAALDGGRILDEQLMRTMESPARLDDGSAVSRYGIANELAVLNGHRVAGHDGGLLGFGAVVYRLPDDRITVVVLADQ